MSADQYLKKILTALHEALRGKGFRKKGPTFWRERNGLIHLVNLQQSQASTQASVRVTVNLAVVCRPILSSWEPPLSVWSGQWKARIGALMAEPSDKWWQIDSLDGAQRAAAEIRALLEERAVPELEAIDSIATLTGHLQAGPVRGVTEVERARHLQRLAALKAAE
jgi:hypothetical protein